MGLPARFAALAPIAPYQKRAIAKIDAVVARSGRDVFLAALTLTSQTDDRLDHLLLLAEDPSYSGRSIGELAVAAGLRAGELLKIIKETALLTAQAHALQVIADALPAVALDAVTRAQNHYEQCPACDGIGKITPDPTKEESNPEPETCKPCRGKGQVLVAADPDRQDRIFEMAKLLPKGGGTNIGVGVNVGKEPSSPASPQLGSLFSQLVAATDRIVHPDRSFTTRPATDPASAPAPPPGDVVDATIVPPETP